MPYQLPLTFRQIEDQYNKARSSGLFSEGSLQDYAKVGDQFYPGKYQAVSDRSWLGVKAKGLSTGIDRALESTGLPQAAGDLSKWAFEKFGGTPEVGQQVGETIPRAAGAMAAGIGVGKLAGGLLGGVLGAPAAGVGAAPGAAVGQEIGGWIGGGLTAFLFGLDAYEKSDSLKAAAFAAAVPTIAGKFSQAGTAAAMKILPKIPGAAKIGLTGFGETSKIVESATANPAFNEAIKHTTRGLEGTANKLGAFAGSQVGVVAGFAGLDALQGDVRFDPDYWLSQAVTAIPFGIPEAHQTFRKGFVPLKTTMGKPEKIFQPILGPESPRDVREKSFLQDYISAKEEQRPGVIRAHGFDTVIEHSIIQQRRQVEKARQAAFKANEDSIKASIAQEPVEVQQAYEKARIDWDNNKKIIRQKSQYPAETVAKAEAFLSSKNDTINPEIRKKLVLRERLKSRTRSLYTKQLNSIKSPHLDLISLVQMTDRADGDLRIFGLNNHKLIEKPKGHRDLQEYAKILRPKGWKPGEIKNLFFKHLRDAKLEAGDKPLTDTFSAANLEKYGNESWFTGVMPEVKMPAKAPAGTQHPGVKTAPAAAEPSVKPSDTTQPTERDWMDVDSEVGADSDIEVKAKEQTPVAVDPAVPVEHVYDEDVSSLFEAGKALEAELDANSAQDNVTNPTVVVENKRDAHISSMDSLAAEIDKELNAAKGIVGSGLAQAAGFVKVVPKMVQYAKMYIELKVGDLVAHLKERFGISAEEAEKIRSQAEEMREAEYAQKPELKHRDALLDKVVDLVNKGGITDKAIDIRDSLNEAKRFELKYNLVPKADMFRRAIDSRLQDVRGEFNTASTADANMAKVLFEMRDLGDTPSDTLSRVKAIARISSLQGHDKVGRPPGYDEAKAERQKTFEKEIRGIEQKLKRGEEVSKEELGKKAAYDVLQNFMTYPQYLQLMTAVHTTVEPGKQRLSGLAKETKNFAGTTQGIYGPKHPGDIAGKGSNFEPKYSVLTDRLLDAAIEYAEGRLVQRKDNSEGGEGRATGGKLTATKKQNEAALLKIYAEIERKGEAILSQRIGADRAADIKENTPEAWRQLLMFEINAEKIEAKAKFEGIEPERAAGSTFDQTMAEITDPNDITEAVKKDLTRLFMWHTSNHYKPEKNSSDLYETRNAFVDTIGSIVLGQRSERYRGGLDRKEGIAPGDEMSTNKTDTGYDEASDDAALAGDEGALSVDPINAARGDETDPVLVAVVKEIARNEDLSLGTFEAARSHLEKQIFNESGSMRPFKRIPEFYQKYLIESGKNSKGEPTYRVDVKAFAQELILGAKKEKAFNNQRTRHLDDMTRQRKVGAFLTREELVRERDGSQLDPATGQPVKFTMLDRMLDTIRQHPKLASQVEMLRANFSAKKLSPEELIHFARFVESRPPPNVHPDKRAVTADGKTVSDVIRQKLKTRASKAKNVWELEGDGEKSFIPSVAKEFGMSKEKSKTSLEEQIKYDNLRTEIFNHLWVNYDEGSNIVVRPAMGRPVDPVRVDQRENAFTEQVDVAEKGISVSDEIPPQIELPGEQYPPTGVEFPQRVFEGGMMREGTKGQDQPSAWTQSYLTRNELRESPLGQTNTKIVNLIDKARKTKSLPTLENSMKLLFDKYVQPGKPIPVELQGGLRLIAETYGKKWESSLLDQYRAATRLNVDAQKFEEKAASFDERLAPANPSLVKASEMEVKLNKAKVILQNDALNKLLSDPGESVLKVQKARNDLKAAEQALAVSENKHSDLLMHGEPAKKEQARLRATAELKRNEAVELLKSVGPLQAKFDKMQSFAPGFRGAEARDTDFLNWRARLTREEVSVPPPEVHPESQKILDRLGATTDGIMGNNEETRSLAFKMQDDGFVGTIVPESQMGDLWIGKDDLNGLLDAEEGGRLVAYFAKSEELKILRGIKGLTETKNGNDILFHSELPTGLDAISSAKTVARHAFERVGETDVDALMPAVEGIYRLYSPNSRVRFLDITNGSNRSGFTNVRGKVQKIWQQVSPNWHGFSKGEKVRAYLFTMAHEMSHGIEFAENNRTLSPEGVKARTDVRDWARQQDPAHLADIIDFVKNKVLPKDWRNNEGINEVLKILDEKGTPRSVEEFMTNIDAMMQVGFLEQNNADFRDAMRAMPVPVRNLWQWFMTKMQNFARVGKSLFKGQAKKDSEWITEKMSQLRKEANKAEQDIHDMGFLADLQSDKMAERMGMIGENLAEGQDWNKWEPVFRGAEEVEPGNTRSGAVTKGTALMNRVAKLLFRLEPESLAGKSQAQVLSAMMSMNHWQKQATQKVLGPVFGTESGVDITGRQTRAGKEYEAYMKNDLFKRIGNLVRDWTIAEKNVNEAKFVDGKFQEDKIFPQGSEGRRLWNNLSGEQKAAIIKHEAVIHNAYDMQKGMNLEGREHHFKALMAYTLGAKEQNMHSRAFDLSSRLYETLKGLKSTQPDVAMKALQDYKSLESEFDNAALLKSMTEQGQEFIRMNEELKAFYDERKSYENIQQFSKYVTTMIDSEGKKKILSAGTAKDIQNQMNQAMKDNPDLKILHEKTPGDTGRESSVDTKLFDLMGRHHQRAINMLNSGMLGSFDAETKQGLLEAIGDATAMDKIARDQAAKTNYLPGSNRKGHEGFEKLDRTAQLFNYVSASNAGLSRAATKARALHELNSPELKNNLDLKNRLKQQVDQYLTPDSELGTAVTKWMAVTHLGLNWPSHVFELTQPLMMAIPALQRLGHTWGESLSIQNKAQGAVATMYKNNVVDKAKRKSMESRPEIKTGNAAYDDLLMKAAARDEIDTNSMMEVRHQQKEAEAYSKLMNGEKPEGKVSKILNAYADFSMNLYHYFPRHNNFVGHIMGYESAMKRVNPDTGKKFTHDEAVEEAIRFNRATMITGGRAGRQADPYKNKTVGQIMMSLQSYSTSWLTGFVRYMDEAYSKERHPDLQPAERAAAKKAALGMLGSSIFFSGLVGAPFAGALAKLASELLGEDLEAKARETLQDITKEPALVDAIMEGGANMLLEGAGIPIDMSAKMGIGGAFGFNPITGYSAASLLGPTASLANRVFESIKPLAEGDIAKAISIGGPSGVRKMAEMISNEGKFKAFDGSPLFEENDEQSKVSKYLYALGFGNQDVKRARTNSRLENSVQRYENEKASKVMTEISGLIEKKSWLAQQKLMEYVNSEVTEIPGYESLNSVQQQMLYRKTYADTVSKLASKYQDLKLPVDPRREVSDKSARTMTALMSGVKAQMPPSSVLTRMALRDAVYQKMGIAPPETSRKEYNKAFMLDQIQNRNPGWTMPQVRNQLTGF